MEPETKSEMTRTEQTVWIVVAIALAAVVLGWGYDHYQKVNYSPDAECYELFHTEPLDACLARRAADRLMRIY
jgi:hypothetical protein